MRWASCPKSFPGYQGKKKRNLALQSKSKTMIFALSSEYIGNSLPQSQEAGEVVVWNGGRPVMEGERMW